VKINSVNGKQIILLEYIVSVQEFGLPVVYCDMNIRDVAVSSSVT